LTPLSSTVRLSFMPRILDNLEILKKIIIRTPFGLITDMDGTINPIPNDFNESKISPMIFYQLTEIVPRLDLVAIVSGREVKALKEIVHIEGIKYIGHYGLEWLENNRATLHPDVSAYLPLIRALAKEIETLREIDGMIIQDKWATISIHYHLSTQPDIAKARILEILKKSPNMKNLRIMEEKTDIGIVPPISIDKGTTVVDLISQHHLRSAIFLGDDIGDVPAFRAIRLARSSIDLDGLAILVTSKGTRQAIINEADFTLNGVQDTEALLTWLIDNCPVK
jgi:trehalose 6-phosphate phosphatase